MLSSYNIHCFLYLNAIMKMLFPEFSEIIPIYFRIFRKYCKDTPRLEVAAHISV